MKRTLGILVAIAVGALALNACVVVDDDYYCDDGEILIEAGDVSCDGWEDCYDGSDEWDCGGNDYVCDNGDIIYGVGDVSCDDQFDCFDLSDELGCYGCGYDEVNCLIGGVDDCALVCDTYVDCDDGWDESDC